jgi:hypothetical protein
MRITSSMRRWPRWPRSEPGPRRPDCRGLSYRYRRPRAPWGPVPAARTRGAFPRPRCAPSGRAVLDFLSLQGNELVGRVELIELRAKVERVDPGVVFRQHKVVGLSQKDVPSGDDLLFQCGGSDPKLLRGAGRRSCRLRAKSPNRWSRHCPDEFVQSGAVLSFEQGPSCETC